ncbi:hypothetical protein [Paraflavitalea sp. CAU 1676]|uniref:hypothetical protein n=1 Tax=Paraflavitalea sp. CAU 1676 TaxID=3032598 RepID=UPI0023DBD39B|nr:hypothetical protein [Paraflavitalea sp. CAU 1676]MDF2191522.1 hypothetical protein [Paraflavitalea sp. CAU 1676]
MKKPVILFGMLVAGSLAFTSCTKNLKDDVSDLKKEIDSLNKSNAELEGQVGGIEIILGANEPITATTTFTDNNNATVTVKDTYKFKAGNSSTQYAKGNSDGTYRIYIERFSDVEWYEGARVEFVYNPTTKEITQKRVRHYWDSPDNYNDNADYGTISPTHSGLQINITVNNFNATTGEISLTVAASGDATYSGLETYYSPNPGKPYSTSFAYTGKVKVFPYVP